MALQEGWGGIRKVQNATGLSAPTIIKGMREVRSRRDLTSQERLRPPGAGRKPVETTSPPLLKNLNRLVEESAAGDPRSSLRWVHKSTRTLAQEMTRQGHRISQRDGGPIAFIAGLFAAGQR